MYATGTMRGTPRPGLSSPPGEDRAVNRHDAAQRARVEAQAERIRLARGLTRRGALTFRTRREVYAEFMAGRCGKVIAAVRGLTVAQVDGAIRWCQDHPKPGCSR